MLAAVALAATAPGASPAHIAQTIGHWAPPHGLRQEPLWPSAPSDARRPAGPPEHSETGTNPKRFAGRPVTGVYDVAIPALTIFPPTARSRHAAVLVFPGGGFKQLAIDLEGSEACDWFAARGFTCALVKYRVPDSDHHYDPACDCGVTPARLTAWQDAQRAIRIVRARAATLAVDPRRVGVAGFSAGGFLVARVSNMVEPAYARTDAIDRASSRPDFAIALYPGHLCRDGRSFDPGLAVRKDAPPTFLVAAWNDPTDPTCNSTQYARALAEAGVPAEVHLFARGGHAFGLRPTGSPVDHWPDLLEAWLDRLLPAEK
ncbi:alpha/beta hydrolase [Sphingomonas sp. ASV193]|uniref:alpha/beta hydrolase n=1 Tax=Sphingomonas sp. ASV193 TaxID=3144405 RepID=UPI0032E8D291